MMDTSKYLYIFSLRIDEIYSRIVKIRSGEKTSKYISVTAVVFGVSVYIHQIFCPLMNENFYKQTLKTSPLFVAVTARGKCISWIKPDKSRFFFNTVCLALTYFCQQGQWMRKQSEIFLIFQVIIRQKKTFDPEDFFYLKPLFVYIACLKFIKNIFFCSYLYLQNSERFESNIFLLMKYMRFQLCYYSQTFVRCLFFYSKSRIR